jgi:hypothetical protein
VIEWYEIHVNGRLHENLLPAPSLEHAQETAARMAMERGVPVTARRVNRKERRAKEANR